MKFFDYDPTYLKQLLKKTGLSYAEISQATGISFPSLRAITRAKNKYPSMTIAVALADYLAVPMDLILGRCDEEVANQILTNYSQYFMKLRRAPYETYLIGRRTPGENRIFHSEGETPWPYNLLDAVLGQDQIRDPISAEHEADIVEIISTLGSRRADCLLAYYREGKTDDEIGAKMGLTRTRTQQIRMEVIRKLRHHPENVWVLRYGNRLAKNMNEIRRKELELNNKKLLLEEAEREIQESIKKIGEESKKLKSRSSSHDSLSIQQMGLSTRAINCLRLAGCYTLGDVEKMIISGKIFRLKSLGRKSAQEIISKVFKMTSESHLESFR